MLKKNAFQSSSLVWVHKKKLEIKNRTKKKPSSQTILDALCYYIFFRCYGWVSFHPHLAIQPGFTNSERTAPIKQKLWVNSGGKENPGIFPIWKKTFHFGWKNSWKSSSCPNLLKTRLHSIKNQCEVAVLSKVRPLIIRREEAWTHFIKGDCFSSQPRKQIIFLVIFMMKNIDGE